MATSNKNSVVDLIQGFGCLTQREDEGRVRAPSSNIKREKRKLPFLCVRVYTAFAFSFSVCVCVYVHAHMGKKVLSTV
jgi:hypothetical protein